ncbi:MULTISPECIES: hypothetical protein [Acinetobacter calcoaceticus/baumannii complex]|uniref:hypothetical protein n=1 Tax=Acinetobacter calcoaceticus/baumannii complex TaxID=909768 RepID=UPI00054BE812|nr:hypothetical protein [Acinetobacter baumannii]AYY91230.1 hypothetical protein EGM95_20915 [Acinetobacter baumannii]QBR79268.1 hypothetical protein E4K03_19300 [Acinetobacter baumannii]
MDAYDKDMNLIGDFDGEFVYSISTGEMLPFRIDEDLIFTTDNRTTAQIIGRFEDGKAIHSNGELLFQCD